MSAEPADPTDLLKRSVESGRIHSAYLLSGAGPKPREAAAHFARSIVCQADPAERPCEACSACRRSTTEGREPIAIDGTGKKGPLYRHVGDHPDLFWVERDPDSTRVRIGQVRAIQRALRLRSNEGGWRVVVIADAEWLNQEAQNALLRLLEEPPDSTALILVTASATGLLATIRSRCQRVPFPKSASPDLRSGDEEIAALAARLDAIAGTRLPELLDWAEEFRGARAPAAGRVQVLLAVGSAWIRERVLGAVGAGRRDLNAELAAFKRLAECRRDLAQRNANPQMVAERAFLAIHDAVAR